MPATFLTIRYRMRLSTFDCPPVYSSVSIPIIRYLSVVGACRQEEQESGRADRINRSYEELKSVAGIDLSGLREDEQTSAFPFVLAVLASMTALQDEQKSFVYNYSGMRR